MQTLRDWPLFWASVFGTIGLVTGVFLGVNATAVGLMLVVAIGCVGFVFEFSSKTKFRPFIGLLLLGSCCLSIVGVRNLKLQRFRDGVQLESVQATLVEPPVVTARGWKARASLPLAGSRTVVQLEGTDGGVDLQVGQLVRVTGTFALPRSSATFPEEGYFKAKGIVGRVRVGQLEIVRASSVWDLRAKIAWFRQFLIQQAARTLEAPADKLTVGVVFGIDAGLPQELVGAFRLTRMSHVLVASGTNVVILLALVELLAVTLAFRARFWLAVGLVGIFIFLAGGEASIVRASIFGGAFLLARVLGRRSHLPTTIAAVVFLMGFINPWVLVYDIGFQLSFAAVLGLAVFGGWLLTVIPGWMFPEYLAPTLAAQIATLPVLVYHFGQVSVIAPLANLILGPVVPFLMAMGVLAIILPWLRLVAWLASGIGKLFLLVTLMFSRIPWAAYQGEARHVFPVILACLPLIVAIVVMRRWSIKNSRQLKGAWFGSI